MKTSSSGLASGLSTTNQISVRIGIRPLYHRVLAEGVYSWVENYIAWLLLIVLVQRILYNLFLCHRCTKLLGIFGSNFDKLGLVRLYSKMQK